MVMQLDDDSSMDEIMRAALAGDPKMLKVPEKGLRPPERKNTSLLLRQAAATFALSKVPEDLEDSKRFKLLADKNISGLLTVKEAEEIVENLEAHNPVIVDIGTERWVETSGDRG